MPSHHTAVADVEAFVSFADLVAGSTARQRVRAGRMIEDRLRTAVRTLRVARVPVTVDLVLRGADLDLHLQASDLAGFIEAVAEGMESVG